MKKKTTYPSKNTINLAIRETAELDPRRSVPLIALVLILVLAFGKFAVADRLKKAADINNELNSMQNRSQQLKQAMVDYHDVLSSYRMYSSDWINTDGTSLVDRLDVLSLIDAELIPSARVIRYSIRNDTLTVDLGGITLEDTSRIVSRLQSAKDVVSVNVYNASSKSSSSSTVTMLIIFDTAQEGGQAQ